MNRRRNLILGLVFVTVGLYSSGAPLPPAPPGDHEPVPIKRVEPRYPSDLARAGVDDVVKFEYFVETTGEVKEVRIIKARAPEFAKATIAAVKKWKFKPGVKNGVYVRSRLYSEMVFELTDAK